MEQRLIGIAVIFASRCLLVLLFLPFSALDKVLNTHEAVDEAAEAMPRPIAKMLVALGLFVEIAMSLAILTGVADRLAAFVLAGYCLVTACLWKQFWKTPDFRLKGPSKGREVFWDFLKNVALAGGFLILTTGGSAAGVDRFLADPVASSHPYNLPSNPSATSEP